MSPSAANQPCEERERVRKFDANGMPLFRYGFGGTVGLLSLEYSRQTIVVHAEANGEQLRLYCQEGNLAIM